MDTSIKENNVKEFTATQLKQELGSVMNAAQSEGEVRIVSRSRPDMFLMTWEGVAALINKTAKAYGGKDND